MDKIIDSVNKYIFSKYTAIFALSLWGICSLVWTCLFKHDIWYSDYGIYQYYATICAEAHTMYPNETFLHNECILNPGWINILTLWYVVFKNFSGVPYLLLCLNALNAWLLWLICGKLSERRALKYIAFYCYLLIPAFATNSIVLATEVPYITFSLLSFYLCLRKEYLYVFLAGVSIAIAFWIRPLAEAWIVAALFLLIAQKQFRQSIVYMGTVALTCATIAMTTHINFPDYVYKSTTGGVNLLMGANDAATGTYVWGLRKEGGAGYLPGLRSAEDMPVRVIQDESDKYIKKCSQLYRYDEVDEFYKETAIDWIKTHPWRWIAIIPAKMQQLLFRGTFTAYPMANAKHYHHRMVKYLYDWQQIFVSFIMIISIFGLFFPMSWKDRYRVYVVIPIILAFAMTCMCIGHPRFNFIFMPLVLIYFSYTMISIMDMAKKILS